MSARIAVGDRVRHMVDPIEGIVSGIDVPQRPGQPATIRVHLDQGGEAAEAEGFWQRLPGYGSMDRRAEG